MRRRDLSWSLSLNQKQSDSVRLQSIKKYDQYSLLSTDYYVVIVQLILNDKSRMSILSRSAAAKYDFQHQPENKVDF